MGWSEDSLHRWLLREFRSPLMEGSYGHDAAVLDVPPGREVCCVDQTIEGVHYDPGTRGQKVGVKAAGRALSDLAATAAEPRALLAAISAPPSCEESWLRAVITSLAQHGDDYGADLVGGDLACAPGPCRISVTALGYLPGERRPVGRDRAKPGQVLVATGPFGGSRAGRHLRVRPRIDEGLWLAENGATAMMDVSDGLALDCWRLARASGCRLVLEHVPVHEDAHAAARRSNRSAVFHALNDGEDHELIATLSGTAARRLAREAARECPGLAILGRVEAGSGLGLLLGARKELSWTPGKGGYLHGS